MTYQADDTRREERTRRWELLHSLDRALDGPLVILSFVWLALLVIELVTGPDVRLDVAVYAVWAVFIFEVAVGLLIAPDRLAYLRQNWLKVIALLVPALRLLRVLVALRILRAASAVRSASLLRILTSLNRSMGALGRTLGRTRFAYVLSLTALVSVVGAAGLLFFEQQPVGAAPVGMQNYGDAIWSTAMLMTTVGSDFAPVTPEGRVLTWLLAVYAVGVLGYVTATIAGFFLGIGDTGGNSPGTPGEQRAAQAELTRLRRELKALRAQREPG